MFQRQLTLTTGSLERPKNQLWRHQRVPSDLLQAFWQSLVFACVLLVNQFALAAAPVVSVTSPTSNSKFIAPASITITANASNDVSATITKVQFYRGTTLLGTSTTAPYSYTWTNVAAGSYSITAKATNSLNQVTTSTAVPIVVNNLPTISLTAPTNNTSVAGLATVTLTASASDTGGSIAKVEFYNGTTLIATDTKSPYSYSWTGVAIGTYSITAKATDNLGDTRTTSPVTLTVTNPLTTSVTAPANNSTLPFGSAVTISANASTSKSGTSISKVEFYNGTTLIGTDTSSPYSLSWTPAAIGSYNISTKVTDSQGLTQTSSPITIKVQAPAPTVTITAPANNANFVAPATFSLTSSATANGAGNSITKVEYYQGASLIGTATSAPYAVSWNNVTVGSYSISAKATDIQGLTQTSAAIIVNVNGLPSVSITAPATNSSVITPANVDFTANASAQGAGNSINKVDYYQGATLIGTATIAPYAFSWTSPPIGNYNITAKATDNRGLSQTSAVILVKVLGLPTINFSAPANNTSYVSPSTITLTADATAQGSGTSISKVEFYQGGTLLGTANTAPYTYTWSNPPVGDYSLSAKATDSNGLTRTSSIATIQVRALPTVNLITPAPNASFTAPASVPLCATATANGTGASITQVEYYQGSTLIATVTAAPYDATWNNVSAGNYSLTAKATDSNGLTQTSAPIAVQVNSLPTINLTSPLANANFIAPASISLTSNPATVGAGVTISKVEYYQDGNLIATATTAPFAANWNNVIAGSYSLSAKVTDSNNNSTTSTPVAITVINNTVPTVGLTINPSNGTAPATLILTATATDTDGSIAKVELFNGSNLLTTLTATPYTYLWENVPAGNYILSAKATDNVDATTTSSEVPVTVVAHVPKIYDIHADHLGTPRMVTDVSGNSVWEWIGTPFGESLPNQNPNNTGAQNDFVMNLRFPGQVFDQETGLHYNYFRDYDPKAGRYVQSDPIGLNGGINTFDYVNGRPFENRDVLGLAPGLSLSGSGSGYGSGYGNGGTPSGARAFENFFKTNISPVHDRKGTPITVNVQVGVAAQAHALTKGGSTEWGFGFDNNGNFGLYRKFCVIVGPGLSAGAGPSVGAGAGGIDNNDWSESYGVTVGTPGGSSSIEMSDGNPSYSFDPKGKFVNLKPQIAVGASCGVMKCWQQYYKTW